MKGWWVDKWEGGRMGGKEKQVTNGKKDGWMGRWQAAG